MYIDVWQTLFAKGFDDKKYLYHYTNIDKAIKIIHSNSLRFSSISTTNDTSEQKIKIHFPKNDTLNEELYNEKVKVISDYLKKHHPQFHLLCFSTDTKLTEKEKRSLMEKMSERKLYYDVTGRGFALPRMWAQYASNNEGVCFVINKEKLMKQIMSKVEVYKYQNVRYKKAFDNYILSKEKIDSLYKKISSNANGSMTLVNLFQKDDDFVKYNYFEKLDDWKNEQEFRILAYIDDPEYIMSIDDFNTYIEGVVIGEKIDPAYEKVIRKLISEICKECSVKKITFENYICRII
ncbi:DUF2971 domain-containing protein [Thomasclavelia spiroformis]|uniref:DUF2971 domain-containing protein n=1 Tax=Thomasclavelia spiroformis TaxID=29348 RepID=UPI00255B7B2C|nr:DUF2971 domain-containing protein [Thomasclavelia spiroformis]